MDIVESAKILHPPKKQKPEKYPSSHDIFAFTPVLRVEPQ
jgi:hypothetical protein